MTPKYKVQTRDLEVIFYSKSFTVSDYHTCVWLGRDIPENDGRDIADLLQALVEQGKHPASYNHYNRGLRGKVIKEDKSWQAQEIAALRTEVDELQSDLERAHSHIHWLEGCAIATGEE